MIMNTAFDTQSRKGRWIVLEMLSFLTDYTRKEGKVTYLFFTCFTVRTNGNDPVFVMYLSKS